MVVMRMTRGEGEEDNDDQPVPKPGILPPVFRKHGAQEQAFIIQLWKCKYWLDNSILNNYCFIFVCVLVVEWLFFKCLPFKDTYQNI